MKIKKRKKFKLMDTVEWISQAQGISRKKRGVVIAVVPVNQRPIDCVPVGYQGKKFYLSYPRLHESYLVRVGKSIQLNWPLVQYLKKVKP